MANLTGKIVLELVRDPCALHRPIVDIVQVPAETIFETSGPENASHPYVQVIYGNPIQAFRQGDLLVIDPELKLKP